MRVFLSQPNTQLGATLLARLKKRKGWEVSAMCPEAEASKLPRGVSHAVVEENIDSMHRALLYADIVLFELHSKAKEAKAAIQYLSQATLTTEKVFVCISSTLTWAAAAGSSAEDVLTEDLYPKRKPLLSHKACHAAETLIRKARKTNLLTYVVCAGLIYGGGEDVLHPLFKEAWHGRPVPCYGPGNNVIPMIHATDLANIILHTATERPETQYLLAVDNGGHTLQELSEVIARKLGSGKVEMVDEDTTALSKNVESLLVNLRMEMGAVGELNFRWQHMEGFVRSVEAIVEEFRDHRNLHPLRIILQGPPASGKTFFAEKLASEYTLTHIKIDEAVNEARKSSDKFGEEVRAALEKDPRLPSGLLLRVISNELQTLRCINQGFILDGYPQTEKEMAELFPIWVKSLPRESEKNKRDAEGGKSQDDGEEEDEEDENEEGEGEDEGEGGEAQDEGPSSGSARGRRSARNKPSSNLPENVIFLDSPDEVLKERLLNLPEAQLKSAHSDEEGFTRRLKAWRDMNATEVKLASFFRDYNVEVFMVDSVEPWETTYEEMKLYIGPPHNYGPPPEVIERMKTEAEGREAERQALLAAEKEEQERKELRERTQRQEREEQLWNELKQQEQDLLETRSIPLRKYLMDNVIPPLTEGMIKVAQLRPEDPIDFLAEYLFRHDPNE